MTGRGRKDWSPAAVEPKDGKLSSVWLGRPVKAELVAIGKRTGTSVSALVRMAVETLVAGKPMDAKDRNLLESVARRRQAAKGTG